MLFNVLDALWCVAVFYGCYFYYVFIMGGILHGLPEWLTNNILFIIWAVALVFYVVFERYVFTLRKFLDRYLCKIIK